jgi:uncharacterized membrane protein
MAVPSLRARRPFSGAALLGLALLPFACDKGPRNYAPSDLGGAAGDLGTGGDIDGAAGSPPSGGAGPTGGSGPTGGNAPTGGSGGGSTTGVCEDHDCENGAACLADGDDAYTCDCQGTGFGGEFCQTEIDECDPNPCLEGAECSNLIADYSCDCPNEYAGKDCSFLTFESVPDFSARDLSSNGLVLVGSAGTTAAVYANGAVDDLGLYIGDLASDAYAVSDDGEIIVGHSEHPLDNRKRAVVWEGNTIVELPSPADFTNCGATGVTPDGTIIVGTCYDFDNNQTVVRWVDREVEDLGTPTGTAWCYDAVVSGDGTGIFASCSVGSSVQPMRWTAEDGAVLLISTEEGCRMQAVTPDGLTGAGWCSPGGNVSLGFVWTDANGFQIMADSWLLDPADPITAANDISADGRFLAGATGNTGTGVHGVRWVDGVPTAVSDLIVAAGVSAPDWTFYDANEISADGQTLVGTGSMGTWILRLE